MMNWPEKVYAMVMILIHTKKFQKDTAGEINFNENDENAGNDKSANSLIKQNFLFQDTEEGAKALFSERDEEILVELKDSYNPKRTKT